MSGNVQELLKAARALAEQNDGDTTSRVAHLQTVAAQSEKSGPCRVKVAPMPDWMVCRWAGQMDEVADEE